MIDEMILDELREQLLRCREDISTRTGNRSPRQEGLEDTAGRRLRLIDAALEKIDRGTYGDCEGCRRPIAPKRLKAAPWTRLCVRCVEATTASTGEGAGRYCRDEGRRANHRGTGRKPKRAGTRRTAAKPGTKEPLP